MNMSSSTWNATADLCRVANQRKLEKYIRSKLEMEQFSIIL
jgi:hypothetical protein